MPTILTHAAVPLALGTGLGSRFVGRRLVAAGVAAAMLPDLDVIAFAFGVPYGSAAAHRGWTHSVAFALGIGLLGALGARWLDVPRRRAFWFLFCAAVSHGLLDMCTNGGSRIA